jgi:hypothetical protein
MNLTKKLGPLPVWAWGVLGGIAVYFLYVRSRANSAQAANTDPTQFGTDQLSPSSLGTPVDSSLQTTGADSLNNFDTDLMAFLQAQSDFSLLASALGFVPAASTIPGSLGAIATPINLTVQAFNPNVKNYASDVGKVVNSTTAPNVATAPLANAHTPTVTPTVNTQPQSLYAKPPSLITVMQEAAPTPLKTSTLNKPKPGTVLTEGGGGAG